MSPYQSPYAASYLRREAAGEAYDRGISNKFELAIFDLELRSHERIYRRCLASKESISYLDYAAGTGRILQFFADKTSVKYAVDTSPLQLERARSKVPDATFVVDNVVTNPACLPLQFDLITCFRLMLNLEEHNRAPLLQALMRCLKDDGILIVDNHLNRHSILGWTAFFMRACLGYREKGSAAPGERRVANTLSESAVRELLEGAGLQVCQIERFMILPGHKSWILLPRPWLVALEQMLAKAPGLNRLGKNQIFVCRKRPISR
jgi:SAM-dependent methyltransferase